MCFHSSAAPSRKGSLADGILIDYGSPITSSHPLSGASRSSHLNLDEDVLPTVFLDPNCSPKGALTMPANVTDLFSPLSSLEEMMPERAQAYLSLLAESTTTPGGMQKVRYLCILLSRYDISCLLHI